MPPTVPHCAPTLTTAHQMNTTVPQATTPAAATPARLTAYLRVSTDAQDERSQREQITAALTPAELARTTWITDTASGGKPWQARKLLDILRAASPGDTILVSEISRIARSTCGVLTFLEAATARGVHVRAIASHLTLDGSLPSQIVVTVLALAAQIERDLLRTRTAAALAARRAAGQRLGRPPGPSSRSILDPRADEIQRCRTAHVPIRAIARLCAVSPGTLYRYLQLEHARHGKN